MKPIIYAILTITLIIFNISIAEIEKKPAKKCISEQHRQFDFWLGKWQVYEKEKLVGTNHIKLLLDGCVLQENWKSETLTGTSYNIYDAANDKWHQTWVDSTGLLLELDGKLVDGNMVLQGKRPNTDKNGMVTHRITWSSMTDDKVRQLWEASKDGKTWKVLFDGEYRKEK